MERRKKIWLFTLPALLLVMVTGAIVLGIYLRNGDFTLKDFLPTNDVNPFLTKHDFQEVELSLDGALEEEVWGNLSEVSYTGKTTSTSVKGFYGKNGIYIGATITDPDLADNGSKVTNGSSLELLLDPLGESTDTEALIALHFSCAGDLRTRVYANDTWTDSGLGTNDAMAGNSVTYSVQYGVTADGTFNDAIKDVGYVVEAFIPYELLGGASEINYGIALATIECVGGMRVYQAKLSSAQTSWIPSTYWGFFRETNTIAKRPKTNYATYKVDGKDDDAIWATDRSKYIFANGKVKASNYYASEGVYFFVEVEDDQVYADDQICGRDYGWDDCVLFYLDVKLNGGKAPQEDDFYVVADAAGNLTVYTGNGEKWTSAKQDHVFSGVRIINGKLNGKADGYTMELFMPWVDLGLKSAPNAMGVFFAVHDWDGETKNGVRVSEWHGSGTSSMNISKYIKMTKNHIAGAAPKSEIVLDGVLNDSFWKGTPLALWFGSSVKMQWKWSNSGCYIAFRVTDSNIVTSNSAANKNSSIEIYLDDQGDGGRIGDGNRGYIVDAAGNMITKVSGDDAYVNGSSAAQAGVALTKTGYHVEIYIPWVEFNEAKPTKMGIALAKNEYWKNVSSMKRRYDEYCANPNLPTLYSIFTETEIIDTSDKIIYDSSKWQGRIGFGASPQGVLFRNLKLVTTAGQTKTWSLTKTEQIREFKYYKKDEAGTQFAIGGSGLLGASESNANAYKKAILNNSDGLQSLTVDFYPVNDKINGCVYLGVTGTVGGGMLANSAVSFRITDTGANTDEVKLTVVEDKDGMTFGTCTFSTQGENALYTDKKAQAIRMTLEISGTKVKVKLSPISNLSKMEQLEIDIANY